MEQALPQAPDGMPTPRLPSDGGHQQSQENPPLAVNLTEPDRELNPAPPERQLPTSVEQTVPPVNQVSTQPPRRRQGRGQPQAQVPVSQLPTNILPIVRSMKVTYLPELTMDPKDARHQYSHGMGLHAWPNPGGGDCLFYSIQRHLSTPLSVMEIRDRLHKFFLSSPIYKTLQQQLPPSDMERNSVENVLTKGTWTGTMVLVAAVHCFNIHITLHEISISDGIWTATISEYHPEYNPAASQSTMTHVDILAIQSHYELMDSTPVPPSYNLEQTVFGTALLKENQYSSAAKSVTAIEPLHDKCSSNSCRDLAQQSSGCCQVTSLECSTKTVTCVNRSANVLCPPDCAPTCLQQPSRNYLASAVLSLVISPGNSGLFAAEIIKPYEFIGEYLGHVQTIDEFNDTLDPNKESYIHCRDISYTATMRDANLAVDLIIDALLEGSLMRFANHSCHPNAEIVVIWRGLTPTLFLRASSIINPGEEITFNYNWTYQRGSKAHRCLCNPSRAPHYIEKGVPTTIEDHLLNAPMRPLTRSCAEDEAEDKRPCKLAKDNQKITTTETEETRPGKRSIAQSGQVEEQAVAKRHRSDTAATKKTKGNKTTKKMKGNKETSGGAPTSKIKRSVPKPTPPKTKSRQGQEHPEETEEDPAGDKSHHSSSADMTKSTGNKTNETVKKRPRDDDNEEDSSGHPSKITKFFFPRPRPP